MATPGKMDVRPRGHAAASERDGAVGEDADVLREALGPRASARSDALQSLRGTSPPHARPPEGLWVASQKGPTPGAECRWIAGFQSLPQPPDSHTLGTSSTKDHQQSGARGLKLQVLGEALFPTPARTGDVSDLRTLDHGMGIHGPSHP